MRLACIKAIPEQVTGAGYKDYTQLAADMWGYAKQTTYKMVQVAEKFIEDYSNGTMLCHDDKSDYSFSQLIEMLSLTQDEAKELDVEGIITPKMTTKAIRQAVKEYTKPDTEDTEGTTEDTEGNYRTG